MSDDIPAAAESIAQHHAAGSCQQLLKHANYY